MDKRLRELTKLAKKYDRYVERRKRHYALVCNNGNFETVFVAATPSDRRAMKNNERLLERIHAGDEEE